MSFYSQNDLKVPHPGVHSVPDQLQQQLKLFHAIHVEEAKKYDPQHPYFMQIFVQIYGC